MGELWTHIGMTPWDALGVVIAATVLYLAYSLVLAWSGPRLFSSSSTLSLALLTVLGSLIARGMLGPTPTLAGALVASTTLLVLEALLGRLRRIAAVSRRHQPRVVMVNGRFVSRPARELLVSEADLMARLRSAGVRHLEDAGVVVLEPRGGVTVIRRGEKVDPRLLAGVAGVEFVPAHLLTD
ncbi:YetF domain-containing protein [Propioniciclava soli]|uniref:DUF421 domain-containing protein n=1 Tax=Propioniciclava soli TaxID=2775081 RepID=A0ABZ3C6K9_9ACTN|nr:YetF domain-containing protein [Propioniciclava soli]